MTEDLYYLYAVNILTFALYGWDKHLAVYRCRRVPELVLLFLALIGGAFGALCGMILFRHKTRHLKFRICVPLFLFLQLALVVFLRLKPFSL